MENEEKKQNVNNKPEMGYTKEEPKLRQIIIETDGNNVRIIKNETVGFLELKAVLTTLLTNIK